MLLSDLAGNRRAKMATIKPQLVLRDSAARVESR